MSGIGEGDDSSFSSSSFLNLRFRFTGPGYFGDDEGVIRGVRGDRVKQDRGVGFEYPPNKVSAVGLDLGDTKEFGRENRGGSDSFPEWRKRLGVTGAPDLEGGGRFSSLEPGETFDFDGPEL